MAVWMCLAARGWQRLLAPTLLAIVSLTVASAWLPLIDRYPQIFEIQFRNQFLHDKGGSLIERLLSPAESFAYHAGFLWPHIGWWQVLLAITGALLCLGFGRKDVRPLLTTVGLLSISSACLISLFVGPHHPVFGYFSYPSALAFIGIGWAIDRAMTAMSSWRRFGRVAVVAFGMACVLSMLPGSRIRMNLAYLRNWDNVNFNAPRFADSLLDRLPPDAIYLVDEEFVLDFVRAGRNVIAFRAVQEGAVPRSEPYDFRIASRSTERYFANVRWNDELVWTAGDPDDPYGCFAKVYQRTP